MIPVYDIKLQCGRSSAQLRERLSRAVAPAPKMWSMTPMKISDWLARYDGKTFVGIVKEDRFKVMLIGGANGRVRWRGGNAVIVGTIRANAVSASLRPPIFASAFLILWCLILCCAIVLSFFGPSNTWLVRLLLAGMLFLPTAIFFVAFAFEARRASAALQRILSDPI